MLKLKACLHLHVQGDPIENIRYSHRSLFECAKKMGFDVIAVTCHNKHVWSDEFNVLSEEFKITVIPGIEQTIEKKHVLILNCDKSIEEVNTFTQLREYKKSNPDCCIIAPHPFHMLPNCLGKKLLQHIDIFDALEWNYFYSEQINPNKKTAKVAKKYNKPIVATSDVHILKHIDRCYTTISSPSRKIKDIIDAIKTNKIETKKKAYKSYQLPFSLIELILNTK